MEDKKLTVVIPAFNAEAYIEACIDSIGKQSKSYEIASVIIVVDGSSDNTLVKVGELVEKYYPLVKFVIQENMGPGAARNNGVKSVKTDYVTFLDADDLWSADYLDQILPLLEKSPDLIEYDALRMSDEGDLLNTIKIACADVAKIKEINKDNFLSVFRCYSWARVYKTSLIRSHLFPEDRRFEDTATTPWHYWNSQKIISIGLPLVAYRQHSTSILANPKIEDIYEIALCIKEAVEMYEKNNSEYWRIVVYRIFHFACQRITTQSFVNWRKCIKIAVNSVGNVPPPENPMRKIQRYATHFYIILLYLRYKSSNFLEKIVPKIILRSIFPVR